jgi:hypothetical protein
MTSINDRIIATIRTAVPGAVGYLLAQLIERIPAVGDGIAWFDENLSAVLLGAPLTPVLQAVAVGAVIGAYYWVARKIGDRWPAVERLLLGSSKTPVYTVLEVEDEGAAG